MAMVESIWPSEQLAMALTTPVDPANFDPADPQVGHSLKELKSCTVKLPAVTGPAIQLPGFQLTQKTGVMHTSPIADETNNSSLQVLPAT